MTALQIVTLVMIATAGTLVVLTRDPLRQAIVSGVFGLVLAIMFMLFQAPDVALSMIVVSSVALPALILIALGKIESNDQ